ncbi:MAG: protein kinase [Cyanobacteria bacterium P01_G01_bin.39]
MFNLPPGKKLLNGKYTIEKFLAHGGLGVTYLVKDTTGQLFVLKTIQDKFKFNEKLKNDFYREASKLSECKGHPNIVKIIRLFTEDVKEEGLNGWSFIVMEYVAGQNLREFVSSRQKSLKEAEAIEYIQQIGRALSEVIHVNGNIHRDIKPSNIIIRDKTNEAVLIDFGLARKFNIHDNLTHTKISSGGFSAIEQYEPPKYKDIVKKNPYGIDVYSLAATLYFMLTKTNPPLARDRQNEIGENNRDPLIPPKEINPKISDATNAAIIKGMSVEPEDRLQTIDAFLGLLDPKLDNSIVTTKKILYQQPNIDPEVNIDSLKKQAEIKNSIPTEPANDNSPESQTIKSKLWLAIPASVILGLGAFWAVPKSPSLNATYESEQYGFSFKYPKSWDEGKIESSLGAASDIVAEFIIPTDNPKENNAKFVASVEPLNSFNVSLNNYVDDIIEQRMNNDNVKKIVGEVEVLPAPRNNFKQINYIMEENAQQIERTELIGIDDGKAYTLAYEANIDYFEKLNKTVLGIFDSFKVAD